MCFTINNWKKIYFTMKLLFFLFIFATFYLKMWKYLCLYFCCLDSKTRHQMVMLFEKVPSLDRNYNWIKLNPIKLIIYVVSSNTKFSGNNMYFFLFPIFFNFMHIFNHQLKIKVRRKCSLIQRINNYLKKRKIRFTFLIGRLA